jgi:hypothetical protein
VDKEMEVDEAEAECSMQAPDARPSSNATTAAAAHGEVDKGDAAEDEDVDASVLKILLSTDNHLGYLQRDPIRGRDSFAAFEEVLSLEIITSKPLSLLSISIASCSFIKPLFLTSL